MWEEENFKFRFHQPFVQVVKIHNTTQGLQGIVKLVLGSGSGVTFCG